MKFEKLLYLLITCISLIVGHTLFAGLVIYKAIPTVLYLGLGLYFICLITYLYNKIYGFYAFGFFIFLGLFDLVVISEYHYILEWGFTLGYIKLNINFQIIFFIFLVLWLIILSKNWKFKK